MGMFLDNKTAYNNYRAMSRSRYFADKSAMIAEITDCMENAQRYLCFTRPRRFGKSVMADMVASYFGQCCDSRDIFDGLDISKWDGYEDHINRYSVIYIDFSKTSGNCSDYNSYIERVVSGLKNDIREKYSDIDVGDDTAVWDDLERTGEQYILVLDEWDAVFHMRFMSEDDKHDYLLFLRNLLKDNGYVRLAYMTGVLPIAKYSSGSELNMFAEYSMAVKKRFSEYFGFSEEETDRLYESYLGHEEQPEITRDDLRIWYDGYYNARGQKMYNPRSVICALNDNQLSNYWTSSGPYDEIFYYIKNNIDDVREDIVLMLSGESVSAGIREYAATSQRLETRDEIYSAMVIYGLLTYYNGRVSIPNKELMDKFDELVMDKDSMGYVHELAVKSRQMMEATLNGDTRTMSEILDTAHNTESPILQYNSETELSAVVNLVYLSARDDYRIVREEKAGKGFADFIFYPYDPSRDSIILELKVDASPDEAIEQIKDKSYMLNLTSNRRYTGKIYLIGISYDRRTKTHSCAVEITEQ